MAVYPIVGRVMQNDLSGRFGLLLGAVAAGLTLFAMEHIRHFAQRFAMLRTSRRGDAGHDELLIRFRPDIGGHLAGPDPVAE